MMVEPFGDLDALVRCTAPGSCTVAPALFVAVQSNFGLFLDEGLVAEAVTIPALGPGIRISGLDRADASGRLLRALGLEEGDVLTHLDGASIVADETLERLMLELPTTSTWTLTIGRRMEPTWATIVVTISRGR